MPDIHDDFPHPLPPRLASESDQAFEAFVTYCALGSGRAQRAVARRLRKSETLISRWSAKHAWTTRAASWARAVDEENAEGQFVVEAELERLIRLTLRSHRAVSREVLRRIETEPGFLANRSADDLRRLADQCGRDVRRLLDLHHRRLRDQRGGGNLVRRFAAMSTPALVQHVRKLLRLPEPDAEPVRASAEDWAPVRWRWPLLIDPERQPGLWPARAALLREAGLTIGLLDDSIAILRAPGERCEELVNHERAGLSDAPGADAP